MDHKFAKPIELPVTPLVISGYSPRGHISPKEVTYEIQHFDGAGNPLPHGSVPKVTASTVRRKHVVGQAPAVKPVDQAAIDAQAIPAVAGELICDLYARQAAYYQAHAFVMPQNTP